jgi:lysozyme
MKASQVCYDLIKAFEGLRLKAYQCHAGVWTIGYGHTGGVLPDARISPAEAEDLLKRDVQPLEDKLNALGLTLSQGEFDALISFAFNLGFATLRRSTLMKKLKAGDREGAANEFLRWTFSKGDHLPGLETRRTAERRMFLA